MVSGLKDPLVKIEIDGKSIPATGSSTNEVLYNFVIEVAASQLSLTECQRWFERNTSHS